MPAIVAMHEKALEHIAPQLDLLDLDIELITFDGSGKFTVDGQSVAPEKVTVDYFWLSRHINSDGDQASAFKLLRSCKKVGVLQTFNAGLDDPFYAELSARGTRICNSSAQAVAISEYVFGHVMNIFQPLAERRRLQADHQWKMTRFREIWQTNWLIIGFGPIGIALNQRLKAFEANTAVIRRSPKAVPAVDRLGTLAELKSFLPTADVVVLACALNDETRGLADQDFFDSMKAGSILVNIARGGLVDDAALIKALDSDHLQAAVLDVFHQEPLDPAHGFWDHPKIDMTAHTSFAGSGGPQRWDQLFLENIKRFALGAPLAFEVPPENLT